MIAGVANDVALEPDGTVYTVNDGKRDVTPFGGVVST